MGFLFGKRKKDNSATVNDGKKPVANTISEREAIASI